MLGFAVLLLGFAVLLLVVAPAAAITSSVVVGGLSAPVDIAHANDASGRLFVVEQGGRIRVIPLGSASIAGTFLDISSKVLAGGERGLLGLAFHPHFRDNGRFFVDYTRAGDGATVIAEYQAGASGLQQGDPGSERILLVIPQPFENHNGGALRFGPDGFLYIGMGDGGSGNDPGNRAQDRNELLGKILRIDVDHGSPYAIPAGNPFASGGGRAEIWALGLRNPWRFSFDRATGDFYIGDVGQDHYEEVDYFPVGTGAGANLGWRVMEGFHCTGLGGGPPCNDPSLTLPVFEYPHASGVCSITGGIVYRGTQVRGLVARYLYGDYCNGAVSSLGRNASGAWVARGVLSLGANANVTTFGEDDDGEAYFADYSSGTIRRFVAESIDVVDVVEYYNAALDHYFVTSAPSDINALDSGTLRGWKRTGQSFRTLQSAPPGFVEACRFYIPPALGDSHFVSL
ncbi:MAG TPA: PQQ-dependent sugar dehydrogenase, partial [Casimicrobiaceae bacterium]|nr:PQQ-dependent sugar dehydrogenase [Casimicrobiaceae bacterium]